MTLKLSVEAFKALTHKRIALIGMSGTGKTTLATKLPKDAWFHYSADYRLGTHYLGEAIEDEIKFIAMQTPYLRDLLKSDSIAIEHNLKIENLAPLSAYLGKIGNPEQGGMAVSEFKRRQRLHHDAEVQAIKDIPHFIKRAEMLYGYPHFIADIGGSLCELTDPHVVAELANHCLLLYLETNETHEKSLIERAKQYPKPLYYAEAFFDQHLALYLQENQLEFAALIDPDDFVRWIFPKLFYARLPKYQAICQQYGYAVAADDAASLRDEHDLLSLIEATLAKAPSHATGLESALCR